MGSFFVILGISKLYLMLLRPHQQKAIQAMSRHNKGQVIVPTGGGKTMCMIQDAIEQFKSGRLKTIVVVAPRILLANQLSEEFLEFIKDVDVLHVHSGETHHDSTTNSQRSRSGIGKARDINSYSLHITLYTRYRKQLQCCLILYILMRPTMLFKRTLLKR